MAEISPLCTGKDCGKHTCNIVERKVDYQFPLIVLIQEIVLLSYAVSDNFDQTIETITFTCNGIINRNLEEVNLDEEEESGEEDNSTRPDDGILTKGSFKTFKEYMHTVLIFLENAKLKSGLKLNYVNELYDFGNKMEKTTNITNFRSVCNEFIDYLRNTKQYY